MVTTDPTSEVLTITLTRAHVGALNDALFALIHDRATDAEDVAGYLALRDDIKRQLEEQR